ncbi:MAG: TonB-dependent receptor [Holophaga sp.]|nr:TonB-dependent receptor [Holophaga sp.]
MLPTGKPALFPVLVVCLASGAPVRAQGVSDLDAELQALLNTPISVSSTKAEGILRTPSTVSVIDRETIRRYNLQTVDEALALVAGVDVMRTHQKRDIVTVRGMLQEHYSSKVLLLIDGIPSWIANTGESNPYRIDPSDVERIEILRGPASVQYGSNAYVGAVNIVLRKPATSEAEAHTAALSQGGYLGGARLNMAWGDDKRLMVAANVNNMEGPRTPFTDEGVTSGGVKRAPITAPFQDYERVRNASVSFQWGMHHVLLNTYRGDEGFLGNSPLFPNPSVTYLGDGIGNNQFTRGHLVNYTVDATLGQDWGLKAGATYDWQERDFSRRGDDAIRSDIIGLRTSAFLKLNWQMIKVLGLEFGSDWEKRESKEYSRYTKATGATLEDFITPGRSVSEKSAFLQGKLDLGNFVVVLGGRYTKNDLAGSNISPRLTAVYQFNDRNSLKFIAGRSFRAPTLFELFFAASTVNGNPALEPEKATSVEVAYLTAFKGFFVQALVYTGNYEDKIMRIADPLPGIPTHKLYTNGGTFKATGLEFEIKYANPKLVDGFLNVDYLLKTDGGDEVASDPNHYNFKYVPNYKLSAGLSKSFGDWFCSANGTYRAKMNGPENSFRLDGTGAWVQGPSQEITGQTIYSVNLGYTHTIRETKITHTLSVKNVGDKELQTPDYMRRAGLYTVPTDGLGRQASYTMRFNF